MSRNTYAVFEGETNFWWRGKLKYPEGVERNAVIPGGEAPLGSPLIYTPDDPSETSKLWNYIP